MMSALQSAVVRRVFGALFGLAAIAVVVSLSAVTHAADGERVTYKVDTVHSSIIFRIKHLGVSNFRGGFPGLSGEYTIDHSEPSKSTFKFTLPTEKIETFNSQRNDHLRSTDFFNAREYPEITFESTKVEKTGENTYKVTGDLKMHGQTNSITTDITMFPEKDLGDRMGVRSGLDTTFTIKRSKWGMDTYVEAGMLGDEVKLTIGIEGQRQ